MFDLTGRTALVTGATGGIGAEIARALYAAGAHVVLSGTREAVLADLASELGGRTSIASHFGTRSATINDHRNKCRYRSKFAHDFCFHGENR